MTRVLVVDDEPQILRALAINLRARGYEVHTAGNGADALAAAAANPPELVVLDLGLPDMDGTDVIAGLRGWTAVPVLVLSGRSDSSRQGGRPGCRRGRLRHQTFRHGRAPREVTRDVTTRSSSRGGPAGGDLREHRGRPGASQGTRDGADVRLDAHGVAPSRSPRSAPWAACSVRSICWPRCGAPVTRPPAETCACTWGSSGASSRRTRLVRVIC